MASRPTLAKNARALIHLGAGIGGAAEANGRIQASDDVIAQVAVDAMRRAAAVAGQVPRGTVPGGEVRNVHIAGGRYISLLGATPYFHSPADNSVTMVHVPATAAYARAVCEIVLQVAQRA